MGKRIVCPYIVAQLNQPDFLFIFLVAVVKPSSPLMLDVVVQGEKVSFQSVP